jgi:choline kinase
MKAKLDEEQIKVTLDGENRITEISKEVDLKLARGESIGIEKFSHEFGTEIFKILDRKIVVEKNVNEFYERTFEEIIARNDKRNSLYCTDVSEYECIEIDTIEDYYKAQTEFKI